MAEVVVELARIPEQGGMGWTRSLTLPAPEAAKIAEWLDKMLPELIVQAKSGISYRVKASAK